MILYRFGRSVVRVDRLVAIKDIPGDPAKASPPTVRVYFEGRTSVTFEGDDADALRAYVAGTPTPPAEAPKPAKSGRISPPRDPKTGKVLDSAEGGRKNVSRT